VKAKPLNAIDATSGSASPRRVLASTPTQAIDKESSESDSVDDSTLVMVTVIVFDVAMTADLGTWTPVAVDSV
jgi:hypothetical protein